MRNSVVIYVAVFVLVSGILPSQTGAQRASDEKPSNWNSMGATEQAQWRCRNDPARTTPQCKDVPVGTSPASSPSPRPALASRFVDLRVGDPAPDFSFVDGTGRIYQLADYKGKAIVIVWFSPTIMLSRGSLIYQISQCQGLRDAQTYLAALNVAYFMVSLSPAQANRVFVDQNCQGATFPILSDSTGQSAAAYGVIKYPSGGIDPCVISGTCGQLGALVTPRDAFVFASTTYIGPDRTILYKEEQNDISLQGYGRNVEQRLRQLGVKTLAELSASTAGPKTVELGQTIQQVEVIFGKPETIANVGPKTIYGYKAIKVIFTNGKVSDVQ